MIQNNMPKVNDFRTDLAFSNEDQQLISFYHQQFPTLVKVHPVEDLELQKQGVDKILELESGKEIWIEEKSRRTNYDDIFIEMWSTYPDPGKIGSVGWIGRHKKSDYLVYQFPNGEIFLFPFLLLQKAYLRNADEWLKTYGERFVRNPGYRSSGIPVPKPVLLEAIKNEMAYSMVPVNQQPQVQPH